MTTRRMQIAILITLAVGAANILTATESGTSDLMKLRGQLSPVTVPDLSRLDPAVARQLTQARTDMEAAIAEVDAGPRRLAAAYGTLGQLYHAYEFLDEAAACYRNATMLEPDNFAWYHFLGDVQHKQNRLEDAVASFEAAWSLEPNDFAALVNLGDINLELGRDTEAEVSYGRALTLNPSSPAVLAGMGQLALRRRQYEKAVAYFTSALTAVPDANRLHYSLAMAYRGLGRMEEAKQHLEQRGTVGVRAPDPLLDGLAQLREGERVHLVRGRLAFASERYEEARDEFAKAVEADPESCRALVNLGTALARTGDFEAAAERFKQAVTLDPDNPTAHFNLASLRFAQGAYALAEPHVLKVVEATPEDAQAQLLLARTEVALGEDEASLPHFEKASLIDPASADSVVEGAGALVRLGRYFQARRVLEAGLDRIPSSGAIGFALARILAAAPDANVRDGLRAVDLALKLYDAEASPRSMQLVAQALAEAGECEKAVQWQQLLIKRAVSEQADPAGIAGLRKDLERYLAGTPCRPPFAAN